MRLFLLTLMIALLPLRGWVGDVMAVCASVPEQQSAMVTSVQDNCHERQHDAHEASVAPDATHAEGDCGDCSHCQICHSLALTTALLPAEPAQARMRQPAALSRLHSSADPHPGLRPPIAEA